MSGLSETFQSNLSKARAVAPFEQFSLPLDWCCVGQDFFFRCGELITDESGHKGLGSFLVAETSRFLDTFLFSIIPFSLVGSTVVAVSG